MVGLYLENCYLVEGGVADKKFGGGSLLGEIFPGGGDGHIFGWWGRLPSSPQ